MGVTYNSALLCPVVAALEGKAQMFFPPLVFIRKLCISHRRLRNLSRCNALICRPASLSLSRILPADERDQFMNFFVFVCCFFVWSSFLNLSCVFVFQLLEGSFTSQVSHEVDGLIFQPCGVSLPHLRLPVTVSLSCCRWLIARHKFFCCCTLSNSHRHPPPTSVPVRLSSPTRCLSSPCDIVRKWSHASSPIFLKTLQSWRTNCGWRENYVKKVKRHVARTAETTLRFDCKFSPILMFTFFSPVYS